MGARAFMPARLLRAHHHLAAALLTVVVALALLSAGGMSAVTQADGATQKLAAADARAGATVYANQCARCHGPKGEGGVGPSLAAAAFPGLVASKVLAGGGGMPAFGGRLPAADVQNVSAHVAQDLADPAAAEAKVADGGVVFRLYCSGCHGATGRGGALVEGRNAPSLRGRPPANALAAMIRGPRNMPVFTGTLDVRQQASVARYIQATLFDPATPGGLGLGFLGPVIEGFVSWLALALLIFVAVWLARKRGGGARGRS
jgi:ubiquinol-cytochrome c reductase cytochrome c subunit